MAGVSGRDGFSAGQWQCDGSGQQHDAIVVTSRTCETGTASATQIATTNVANEAAARRIFTSPLRTIASVLSTKLSRDKASR
ncbi:MAG TPA: hypothetical protein VGL61_24120 [Kofleriaceae bacterium]